MLINIENKYLQYTFNLNIIIMIQILIFITIVKKSKIFHIFSLFA